MLLSFFRRPLPISISAVVGISILIWLNTILHPSTDRVLLMEPLSPLSPHIMVLFGDNYQVYLWVAFAFNLFSGLYLIQLNSKYILIKYRTYLPALFYIIITASSRSIQAFNPSIISAFFIILSIDGLFSSSQGGNELDKLFKTGFTTGIASLFYLPAAIALPLAFVGLSLFRSFSLRHWLAILFGYLAPWFFMSAYYFLSKEDTQFLFTVATDFWAHSKPFFLTNRVNISHLILIAIFSVFALYRLLLTLSTQKIITRKYYSIFVWLILLGLSLVFFLPIGSFEVLYIMGIPLAFIFAHYFSFVRSRFWGELLFSILFVTTIILQFV